MTTTPISPIGPGVASMGGLAAVRAATADIASLEADISNGPAQTPAPNTQQTAPQSALASAVQTAAVNQGGLASLLSDLTAALQSPHPPASVQAAIADVLGFQLPIDPPPDAAGLRQAVVQSGLFLEAQLATDDTGAGGDLKSALLTLQQALQTWAGAAATRPATTPAPPAPPHRGGPVQGQPATVSSLPPDASASVVAGRLIKDTGAALSRQVLMQAASASGGGRAGGVDPASAQWLFEVPLATPQGPAVAQFEIDRDGAARRGPDDEQQVWRARFSLDVDPMGPVHAQISLSGGKARVSLWAGKGETVARLSERQGELSDALRADEMEPQVAVFPGAPSVSPPPAGQFMDKAI